MTELHIYLLARLDFFREVLKVLLLFSFVFCFIGIVMGLNGSHRNDDNAKNTAKTMLCYSLPILLLTTILAILVPTTKQLAAIYLIPKVVNNEQVQKIPENVLNLLNSKLNEWTGEDKSPGRNAP